jgi:hypothetical protein
LFLKAFPGSRPARRRQRIHRQIPRIADAVAFRRLGRTIPLNNERM